MYLKKIRVRDLIIKLAIAFVLLSFLFMLQPFFFELYSLSIAFLGVGGGLLIVFSYLPPGSSLRYGIKVTVIVALVVVMSVLLAIYIAPILVETTL